MSKKEVVKIDSALFDKLANAKPVTQEAAPVMQKVVPVRGSQRDNEETYTFWINKSLKKDLQKLAINEDTDVKSLLTEAALLLRKQRGLPPLKGLEI